MVRSSHRLDLLWRRRSRIARADYHCLHSAILHRSSCCLYWYLRDVAYDHLYRHPSLVAELSLDHESRPPRWWWRDEGGQSTEHQSDSRIVYAAFMIRSSIEKWIRCRYLHVFGGMGQWLLQVCVGAIHESHRRGRRGRGRSLQWPKLSQIPWIIFIRGCGVVAVDAVVIHRWGWFIPSIKTCRATRKDQGSWISGMRSQIDDLLEIFIYRGAIIFRIIMQGLDCFLRHLLSDEWDSSTGFLYDRSRMRRWRKIDGHLNNKSLEEVINAHENQEDDHSSDCIIHACQCDAIV